MWDDYCGQCIVYRVSEKQPDGTWKKHGDFTRESTAEEYVAKQPNPEQFEIIDWDCS